MVLCNSWSYRFRGVMCFMVSSLLGCQWFHGFIGFVVSWFHSFMCFIVSYVLWCQWFHRFRAVNCFMVS